MGKGIKRATSTSNTINKTASKKNRKEKGIRALPFGSKPHSKEEPFSRSKIVRLHKKRLPINKTKQVYN